MKKIDSINEIADRYDLILFDIWGVIHNGYELFPHVEPTLRGLKAKKHLVTNSPQPVSSLVMLLESFGLHQHDHFDGIISSGELFRMLVREKKLPQSYPINYLFIGPNSLVVEQLDDFYRVSDVDDADILVLAGAPSTSNLKTDLEVVFKKAAKKGIPLYCLNPDLIALDHTNQKIICPGTIAQEFEKLGGVVNLLGKPLPEIFDCVINQYDVPRERILMVGDTIRTDGQGANNSNIDFLLLLSGVEKHLIDSNNEDAKSWQKQNEPLVTWVIDSLK